LLLATAIHGKVVAALGLTDRGLKEADFCDLRETDMAAALVELAFISNPAEGQLLADPAFQRKAATAIAEGIADYLGVELPKDEIVLSPEFRMIDGRAYTPVRALCESISALTGVPLLVVWNEQKQSVEIRKG
jgi:N-acetylmuramoyl-L-alanine amidase